MDDSDGVVGVVGPAVVGGGPQSLDVTFSATWESSAAAATGALTTGAGGVGLAGVRPRGGFARDTNGRAALATVLREGVGT